MLVKTKDLINDAINHNKAIGAFNVTSIMMAKAIILAAEQLNEPVIIEFAKSHEDKGFVDFDLIGPVMIEMAKRSKVDVACHLDHGMDIDYIKKALDFGFTSVMYDGSLLSYEDNVKNTKEVISLANKYGAIVEAELGSVDEEQFTDPNLAKQFIDDTKVDLLACSFGNKHGLYKEEPKIQFDLIKEISDKTKVPLVMHGSSGINNNDYARIISSGVRKINYYTNLAIVGANAIKEYMKQNPDEVFRIHYLELIAQNKIKEHVIEMIKIFNND